jgi:hypothetical protein
MKPLWQLAADVSKLVLLASGDHGMVEHVQDRAAQRLGAVQHAQDRPGDIQATLAQPDQQLAGQGGVLGGASTSARGCLVPSRSMPSVTTQVCSPKWTPSIIRQTRSRSLRSRASRSANAVWVPAQTAARSPTSSAGGSLVDARADRLEPDRVAARRQPAQHPLQRQPAQQLGGREQLVGGYRQLTRPVGGTHPGPLDRHAAAAQGHQAVLVAVAHRRPVGVVLALGPASATTDCSIRVCITCNPAPTDSASRPSVADSAISAVRR